MAGPPVELLRAIPLFADLEPGDLKRLSESFEERDIGAGAILTSEGERDTTFFVIESGKAVVTVSGSERGRVGPGDYLGDIALIDQRARSATVTAETPVRCYALASWKFRPLVESDIRIAWPLLQALARRVRSAERARESPELFPHAPGDREPA